MNYKALRPNMRMHVTLQPDEVAALREACETLRWQGSPTRLARLAVEVVCQEIVNCNYMPCPLAVSLRFATKEEIAARVACIEAKNSRTS